MLPQRLSLILEIALTSVLATGTIALLSPGSPLADRIAEQNQPAIATERLMPRLASSNP